MYLISIDIEYRYNLIKQIREFTNPQAVKIFLPDDLNYHFNYKKYSYIIVEYNPKIIDYFTKLHKNIIICCFDDELVKSVYKNKPNIFICKSKKEVIELLISSTKKSAFFSKELLTKACQVLFVFLVTLFSFYGFTKIDLYTKLHPPQTTMKKNTNVSKKIDFSKENYVFLGDSITDFYDLEKYYANLPVVNSGISGNQYGDLLYHLPERVYIYNPTKVFLLIGTNDIAFTDITNEELVDRIIEICDKIHKNKKNTQIYVESIYPVNKTEDNDKVDLSMVAVRENDRIKEINTLLKQKVTAKKYHYVDMYSLLKDENDNLNLDYTTDGLHISDAGYEVITKAIKKIIYKD